MNTTPVQLPPDGGSFDITVPVNKIVGIVHNHPDLAPWEKFPSAADWQTYDNREAETDYPDLLRQYVINNGINYEYRGDDRDIQVPGVISPIGSADFWDGSW